MARTEVSICNLALLKIGANTITSFTETSTQAVICAAFYPEARDAVLRMYPWNFAIARDSLTATGTLTDWGGLNRFTLPTDFIRFLGLDFKDQKWSIEGRELIVDATAADIRYVSQVTDPNVFDPLYVQALVAFLAAEFAEPITGSSQKQEGFKAEFREKLRAARSRDGMENGENRRWDNFDLLDVRQGGEVATGLDSGNF